MMRVLYIGVTFYLPIYNSQTADNNGGLYNKINAFSENNIIMEIQMRISTITIDFTENDFYTILLKR